MQTIKVNIWKQWEAIDDIIYYNGNPSRQTSSYLLNSGKETGLSPTLHGVLLQQTHVRCYSLRMVTNWSLSKIWAGWAEYGSSMPRTLRSQSQTHTMLYDKVQTASTTRTASMTCAKSTARTASTTSTVSTTHTASMTHAEIQHVP